MSRDSIYRTRKRRRFDDNAVRSYSNVLSGVTSRQPLNHATEEKNPQDGSDEPDPYCGVRSYLLTPRGKPKKAEEV